MTQRIMCYGDSNTWGYMPGTGERYPEEVRWPGALQRLLGRGHLVIEEGLNGRTTVHDDPDEPGRNGEKALLPCLYRNRPLDLVITMLGTNDLKQKFALSPKEIAEGMERLLRIILDSNCGRDGRAPKVLLISPPMVIETGPFREMFIGGAAKSRELARYYEETANRYDTAFLDAALLTRSSPEDGIHLDEEGHAALARGTAEKIKVILSNS